MIEAWRWFGPHDPVALDHVRQAGATDIVNALHELKPGTVWTEKQVAERKNLIETTPPNRKPLTWSIVESIPVPDDVKRLGAGATQSIQGWIASMEAVAACGIKTICYNFMPVVDWTRTDLDAELPTGATCMRFDADRFAAFELFILQRQGVEKDYTPEQRERARKVFDRFTQEDIDYLIMVIASALPGSTTDPLTIPGFRDKLETYAAIDATVLRKHLAEFLAAVTPRAEELGVKLTLHPDDPPRPLFGLPRVASTAADYQALFDAVPSETNGMCFCTGSLGVRADNDLPAMAAHFAPRIHFVHLRATKREEDGSFYESDHLDGDVDMVGVITALVAEDRKRGGNKIPFRPDHGHRMLDDLHKTVTPGYAGIGRLKGLGELRGIMRAVERLT
ncbi:mannonate dehydratase [Rhizobiales bacterium TNE-4]|nr:mannonate dehydratase [Rhizobiales bacterium TNE-4]MBV1826258.1 mannonate dehydratase [Rhizobiales bacterium TNE-4]